MNKISMISLLILSSVSLNACGGYTGVVPVPVKMTRVSVDKACCLGSRPTTKLQGSVAQEDPVIASNTTKNTTSTSVSTPSTAKTQTNLNTKNTEKATDTKDSSLELGDSLPEVTPPPSNNTDSSTQQPEQKKTKVGQFIDKVKNLFKKKS